MALRRLLLPFALAALLALAALGTGADKALAGDTPPIAAAETVVIQMRIWQHVEDADNIWISARPRGGRWDTLGTIPFPLDQLAGGYGSLSKYRYADLALNGIELRVWQANWQPRAEQGNVFIQACTASCLERSPGRRLLWRPLGMIALSLDDGHSSSGRYRYGDLSAVMPRGNPGLLADREHLLALRDVLEGGAAELDWSPSRATEDWEGVTVSGTPPRVTGLDLSERGLTGEIWGYVGDLAELTELRLDGNALTVLIPSKLVRLKQLTNLRLDGNGFEQCVPPPLRAVPDNDLDSIGLPDCTAPVLAGSVSGDGWVAERNLSGGTHRAEVPYVGAVAFDVPAGGQVQFSVPTWGAACDPIGPYRSIWHAFYCSDAQGFVLSEADANASWDDAETWLVVDPRYPPGSELERSHYSGCVYDCGPEGSPAALVEQLMASVWVNTAVGEDGEWVWP